ncbi:MAG: hypothetical protein AAF990_09380 [Bacteroidota bacterium]
MLTKATIKPRNKTQFLYDEACEIVCRGRLAARRGKLADEIDDIRRAFKKIAKLDFNRLSAELARFLQWYYYNHANDRKRGEKYEDLYFIHSKLANIEETLEVKYARISCKIKSTINPKQEVKDELLELCGEIEPYLQYNNAAISIAVFTLQILNAYYQKDNAKYIQTCQEAIRFLKEKGIRKEINFYLLLLPRLIQQGFFDEAHKCILESMETTNKGSNNYYRILYHYILLELYRGRYQQAQELYASTSRIKDKTVAEQFRIFRGYFSFLHRIGKIYSEDKFQLYKFINEVPVFSQDKSGHNVNILVLQFLYYLGKDNGQIIDKIDAIELYRKRYVSGRSAIFLKMLWKILHYQFNTVAIRYRTKKDMEKLCSMPVDIDYEVVPYEVLWDLVMNYLEQERGR